ncbi:redoxin domain-containing protein [Granulicella sp. dw_53]|uniref:TlpA family protein disulfide reductase n=1 Tax=Granulicella sp. dw_53 TaxID=2719792 RepID=UPI001BD6C452
MRRLLSTFACIALLVTGCDRGNHPGHVGNIAPQFTVSDGAKSADLSKLRGRIVVLNLWATWCAPCIEELPSLLEMQRKLPQVTVVAISMDEDPDIYQRFLTKNHVDLLTIRDPTARINTMYGTAQIPETYIIDRNGVLRRKFVSAQNWTSPEILDYLNRL